MAVGATDRVTDLGTPGPVRVEMQASGKETAVRDIEGKRAVKTRVMRELTNKARKQAMPMRV